MSAVLLVTEAPGVSPSDDAVRLAAGAGSVHHLAIDPTLTSRANALRLASAAAAVGADVVVLPDSRGTAEIAALLAHELGAGIVWGVASLRREGEGRPILATKRELGGTWEVTAAVAPPAVVLASPAPSEGEVPEVVEAGEPAPANAAVVGRDVEVVSRTTHERDGVALAGAAVVVAGGRGLLGDLEPVRVLAAALGGAVGATRDIVEEDWIGHEAMVGQTGTMIAPRLYIGAGISGAPHHMLGMRAAETIVAVNLDPDAPLMEAADLAILGDAGEVLTEAARLVRERRGS